MLSIARSSDSKFLDRILDQDFKKEGYSLDRVSFGYTKPDPFEDKALDDVWIIQGKRLMKKKVAKEMK